MSKQILHWKTEKTGTVGHKEEPLPEEFALKHVERLNIANKGKITYWLVPVENDVAQASAPSL